jgi:primosomal protein N' (replication factor Y)
MYYYEVAPMLIIRKDSQVYTYASSKRLSTGTIVLISIGKKDLIGIVIKAVDKPVYETKSIIQTLETTAVPTELIKLATWMSDYYSTHLAHVLQLLVPRGLQKKRRATNAVSSSSIRNRTNIVFNKHQRRALDLMSESKVGTHLLHGVTGSGKTAVYLELARQTFEDGKSVIVLVPEISLTPQVVDEFAHHFPNTALTHSNQTEAERHLVWKRVLDEKNPIVVIGPRSALFLPIHNLGLIIIDEAHEQSYKQELSPRYSALRAASILAKVSNAKLVLGSATPSVVDYYLADNANHAIVEMPVTAQESTRPDVHLVDMTNRENFKGHRFFSDKLIEEIEKALNNGHQALLFHNRRGSATMTLCENCGWQALCDRCFVPMVLHTDRFQLTCHICGTHEKVPTHCPECSHASILHKGIGTKIIESELQKLFPAAKIARFDGDTKGDDALSERYDEIYSGAIDIIVGTQVIAKGLDLPRLQTVGVLQADAGLNLPDFNSRERVFQLLTQVVGRVGRDQRHTSAVVQTYQPTNPCIQDGLARDYSSFYQRELLERKRGKFPPYMFLLQITCIYKTEAAAIRNTRQLAKDLQAKLGEKIEVLGPAPAFYERRHGTYRWQLLVKAQKRSSLQEAVQLIPAANWQFELDPISLI